MDSPHGAAVFAEGFGLKGPRGWAFRSVGVDAGPGSLIAIEGPSGSGRTALLLALTGRMRPAEGRAEVGGLALPRKMASVRRISALGPVPSVSELDPALTVDEHLRERALLQRRFDGSLRALLRPRAERIAEGRARISEALAAAGLDPDALAGRGRTPVRDLERLEALRLSVALALIGRPRLLAVDDADLKLSDADRVHAWRLLRSIAEAGTTVLTVCSQAPEGAVVVRAGCPDALDTAPADPAHVPAHDPQDDPAYDPRDDPAQDPAQDAAYDPIDSPAHDRAGSPAYEATEGPAYHQAHDQAHDPAYRPTGGPAHSPAGEDQHTHARVNGGVHHGEGTADAFAETGRA
ncbi:ATP-binding cassette domain-containing protein [Streptomyces sp. NPDC014894]|uniref:ATP-binding cassette domain-containing protein n=1 Tax=Streptomyces sp. NPDC014894 TaxID=3364931 RepID=UPI0036FBCC75